jgi:hypothetical protein
MGIQPIFLNLKEHPKVNNPEIGREELTKGSLHPMRFVARRPLPFTRY